MRIKIDQHGMDGGLSELAKTMLKHFRDQKIPQLSYEYPATLSELYSSAEECESAQNELSALGYIDLGPSMPRHIPQSNLVRAAAITLEGERFIASGGLER